MLCLYFVNWTSFVRFDNCSLEDLGVVQFCCLTLRKRMDDVVLFVLILLTITQGWCCDHLKMIAMQGNNTTSLRQIGGSSRSSCSFATSVSYSLATSVSENNLESDKYKAHQDLLIHRSSVRFWNSLEK